MSKRVQVYLDEESFKFLENRSKQRLRKPGNLAALWLIERIQAEMEAEQKEQNHE
jgi:hypothetical protein